MGERERVLRLDVGEIKRLRVAKGWNQEQLAEAVGVSKKTIERWETGSPVYAKNVAKLSEALGVSPDRLYVLHTLPSARANDPRTALLDNMQRIWIDGVLANALQGVSPIALSLRHQIDVIRHPLDGFIPQTSHTPQQMFYSADIADVFRGTSEALLILGNPGAGKTTLLIQLAAPLIDSARNTPERPIPVIFNLSSWALQRDPLRVWLVDELNKRYEVSLNLGRQWVEDGNILPLLDGLDEVSPDKRTACVVAINAFRAEQKGIHGQVPMVVCCRTEVYEELSVVLELNGAARVEPLTHAQILECLERCGPTLAGLRDALEADIRLWEIIDTPLMLNIASNVYMNRATELPTTGTAAQRRDSILEDYIDAMFTRRRHCEEYSVEASVHWLAWLAHLLRRNKQSMIHLEWMQPEWLPTSLQRHLAILIPLLASGLSVGFLFGAGGTLTFQNDAIMRAGFLLGLFGPMIFWAFGYGGNIRPIETLRWSWKAMLDNLGRRLFGTLIFSMLFGIFGWVAGGWSRGILMAALSAPAFILFFEIPGRTVETRVIPNQGIRRSFVSGLISFLGGCLAFTLLCAQFFGPPGSLLGVGFGLVVALLNGWHTCTQHLILRVILWRKNYAPWNYVRWLNHSVERLLLRKVGGGYMFAHGLIFDYFAEQEQLENSKCVGS